MNDQNLGSNDHAKGRVIVVGGGSIGVAMAIVFADNDYLVELIESNAGRRSSIPDEVQKRYPAMVVADLAQKTSGEALGRINILASLTAASQDPDLVIEAGPEDLDVKRKIFSEIFAHVGSDTIVATTSSAIPVSHIVDEKREARRCLCAHCVNPPTIMRLIECVPSPDTESAIMVRAADILAAAGFLPVMLNKEIPGFALNRLQGALLREAYRLVADDVISVADLDRVVTDGLGPRWALSGPFETAELNTPGGIKGHAERMGPAYRAMGEERGETDCTWSKELVTAVDGQRREIIALDKLPKRRAWREQALSHILAARSAIMKTWSPATDKKKNA